MRYVWVVLVVAGAAFAQGLTLDQVEAAVEDTFDAIDDATVELVLIDAASGDSIDLRAIFLPPDLARVEFVAPFYLEDQFIVLDGELTYTYLPVTDQVLRQARAESEQLGGLFAAFGGDADQVFDRDQNEVTLLGFEALEDQPTYLIDFQLKRPESSLVGFQLWVADGEWLPLQFQGYDAEGKVTATIRFSNWQLNTGLDPEDVRALPPGAAVVDQE
ncbi:MAG: outer membrane lipoprotein carrier protein LolA [Deinococcus sp.]|nr:outer membrane lipoprotein carrier protein LolA [Deinococcus sp.]